MFSTYFCFVVFEKNHINDEIIKAKKDLNSEINHSRDLIDDQIRMLKEQPLLISQTPSINQVLIKKNDAIDQETNKESLLKDPDLHQLSLTLEQLNRSIGSNQIFLVNSHGYSIASSNWASNETSIGVNYKDRINFSYGLAGKDNIHYAMGRTTHRAGLYFSHPLIFNNNFHGILVIKHDLDNFLSLENHIETNLLDQHNVIVATKRHDLYLKSINFKTFFDDQEYYDHYLTYKINPIKLWSPEKTHPELLKIINDQSFYLKAELPLKEYSMSLLTLKKFEAHEAIHIKAKELFIFMVSVGLGVISLGTFLAIYLLNLKLLNKKLWITSYHNKLTNLPNNERLVEVLKTFGKKKNSDGDGDGDGDRFYLYLIDIDDFRNINRRFGRTYGDLLLKRVSERLKNLTPKDGQLFNNVIDKFSILLPIVNDFNHQHFAASISESLAIPFRIYNESISIRISIASVSCNLNKETSDKILNNVELTLNTIKSKGGNNYLAYSDELQNSFIKKFDISKDLLNISDNNMLLSVFQPIISLSTGKVVKAELLTRLMHPIHGLISPNIFIPLAERNGSIIEIGRYCRKQAIFFARRWSDLTNSQFQISINKSSVELSSSSKSANLNEFFKDIELSNLSGKNFCFELTENQLIDDNEISLDKLKQLSEFGINLSVDDFGTGYSSIAYLKRFPINTIKLDISMVRELKKNTDSEIICASIIEMAHKLNLSVIAEGVETKAQQDILIKMGCDYAQGFFYSPPVHSEDFEKLLFASALEPFDVNQKFK